MNAVGPIANVLLLTATIILVKGFVPGITRRDLFIGATAAVLALGLLAILRIIASSELSPTVLVIPGRPHQTSHVILNLAVLAFVEELAKYVMVAPWQLDTPGTTGNKWWRYSKRFYKAPTRNSRAAGRGLGFATAEHLLFLLIPIGLFARRLLLASTLHIGTALIYARPGLLRRRGHTGTTPILDTLLVLFGTAVHLAYNLLLQGLDGVTVF